jgi:hypothetical protein
MKSFQSKIYKKEDSLNNATAHAVFAVLLLIEAMLRLWQGLVELRTSGRTALVKASE